MNWLIVLCIEAQYALYCGKWVIGRGQCTAYEDHSKIASTIQVSVGAVSRQHVNLEVESDFDPMDLDSVPKLIISDMKTKHGTKWREQRIQCCSILDLALSTVTLLNKSENGILSLSKSCSFK